MSWSHPTAMVDDGAKIGVGTKIWHFSHICGTEVTIGDSCSFGQNVYVGNHVSIGKGCRVQNNVSIYDRVELGDFVFCGPSAVFTNVTIPRAHISRKNEFKSTLVRQGVTLGANCTIVCGVEIGRFAFVAAGAVVSKDVAPFALVRGVPARQSGWVCHCGQTLDLALGQSANVVCSACSSQYSISELVCTPIELKGCFEKK